MEFKDALMEALKLEQDGRNFHARMAEEAPDEEIRAIFAQLAEDEVDHYNAIQRQYQALETGGTWEPIPGMEPLAELDAVSLVFPSGAKIPEALPDNITEEDALLFALGIEDKSFKLYHNSAQQTQDQAVETWFLQLAGAEQRHFEILMMRYESRFGYPR